MVKDCLLGGHLSLPWGRAPRLTLSLVYLYGRISSGLVTGTGNNGLFLGKLITDFWLCYNSQCVVDDQSWGWGCGPGWLVGICHYSGERLTLSLVYLYGHISSHLETVMDCFRGNVCTFLALLQHKVI